MRDHACTEKQFLDDVKVHTMQIIRDDGLERHLRFRRPGTICYGFDIITWPGWLCYTGDMGCFVFSRTDDMLGFFREDKDNADGPLYINPPYWAEKLHAVDRHGGYEEFSKERFTEIVRGIVAEDEDATDELKAAVEEMIAECEGPQECYDAASRFEWKGDQYFSDFWEHSMMEYTFRFIWCCYALVWGIRQYDGRMSK